jgi:hypothetical protein
MVSAGWNDGRIASRHQVLLRAIQDETRLAFLDPEELVDMLVDLIADLFSRLQAHDDQLAMLTREQHVAEGLVVERL